LLVVGVCAALEQRAGQRGVVGDAGGAVEGRLALRMLTGRPEPRIGIRPGVEERRRRPEETVRACRVEAVILRKAEIIQRIPAVGSALSCGVAGMLGEEAAHGGLVTEH